MDRTAYEAGEERGETPSASSLSDSRPEGYATHANGNGRHNGHANGAGPLLGQGNGSGSGAAAPVEPVRRCVRANGGAARVTISDIARHAGVSKTAVSFAFNMPGRLSKQTTAHILEVAKEMGYTPNPIARSLNTRRTNAVGLVVPQDIPETMANPFFSELMCGIGEVCREEGLSLMLIPPMRGSLLDATYAALVDGCIVTGLSPDDPVVQALSQRRIPFVMIDTDAPNHIPSVNVDDCHGAELSMTRLLAQGHRNIAIASLLSGVKTIDDYTGVLQRRVNGVRAALASAGLSLESPGITLIECEATVQGGRDAFASARALPQQPSAIFCMSDAIAWGVIEAARADGVAVPESLAVIGFDDLPASGLMNPALTTVRQPMREKGRRAAQMFVELVRCDGACMPERVLLPVELVVRESA